jgi:hypothetical protein
MSNLAKIAVRAGLISLVGLVIVACGSPVTLPPDTPAAATRPAAVFPSSTPNPSTTPRSATTTPSPSAPPTQALATITPVTSPTSDAWRPFTGCSAGSTPVSRSALPAASSHLGWKHFTVPDYNFAIDMPPDRQLVVVPNALCLAPQASPQVALTIGYRGPIEDVNIVRSGVGAGDLITRGTAIILGKTVPRIVLVYQGKDKAILYNYATEINTPQIVLTASLDDWRTDYDAAVLTPTLQTTADQIVATLATVTLSPTWKTYTSPTFHVSVQYPPNWHPDSSGQALYSGPDGFFSITAAVSLAPTAQVACQITLDSSQMHNGLEPQFGHQPTMQSVQIDRQPACLILPSADQPESYRGLALLFVDYPASIARGDILQFWADKYHIRDLGARLKFIRTP